MAFSFHWLFKTYFFRGARANRKRCEPLLFFEAGNGLAQLAKNRSGCLFRTLFLWLLSFGGAKESDNQLEKRKGAPFETPSLFFSFISDCSLETNICSCCSHTHYTVSYELIERNSKHGSSLFNNRPVHSCSKFSVVPLLLN